MDNVRCEVEKKLANVCHRSLDGRCLRGERSASWNAAERMNNNRQKGDQYLWPDIGLKWPQ